MVLNFISCPSLIYSVGLFQLCCHCRACGHVSIQGPHPSTAAFEDRMRHRGANKAVPFRGLLQMRPGNAAMLFFVWSSTGLENQRWTVLFGSVKRPPLSFWYHSDVAAILSTESKAMPLKGRGLIHMIQDSCLVIYTYTKMWTLIRHHLNPPKKQDHFPSSHTQLLLKYTKFCFVTHVMKWLCRIMTCIISELYHSVYNQWQPKKIYTNPCRSYWLQIDF